jgi:hypothetical protein
MKKKKFDILKNVFKLKSKNNYRFILKILTINSLKFTKSFIIIQMIIFLYNNNYKLV